MCDYCEKEKYLMTISVIDFGAMGFSDKIIAGENAIYIDRGYLRVVDTDDCNCLDHGQKIKIKFCPFCGDKL